jgi:hypothetical protein
MTKLELRLERLECRVQGDASGGSEPYLWPMLLWVTDATIGTPTPVRSNHAHTPRSVLGQNVKAGATLVVPTTKGTVGTQLAAGDTLRRAIAVVALHENDETPHHVVVAAHDAYVRALPAAVASHLLELASNDPVVIAEATAAIKQEVQAVVKSAGSDEMTAWEKFKVGIGSLDLDDQVEAAFADTTTTRALDLTFRTTKGSGASTVVTQDWRLTGVLVVDNRIDLCASQEQAVAQATVRRNQARQHLQALQAEYAQASAAEREILTVDIDEAKAALGAAEGDLAAAEAALARCRTRGVGRPPIGHLDDVIVATDLQ